METEPKEKRTDEETLLRFLKLTKDGEYAEIEQSSLPYSRFPIQRDDTFYEEEFLYSMR